MKNEIHNICKSVGQYIMEESPKNKVVEIKALNSLVSYVDKRAEQMIIEKLSMLLPEATFLAEESSQSGIFGSTLEWIIDPLDGTTNYLHGVPVFAISIALRAQQEYILGAVYNISTDVFYFAEKGKGATKNDEPLLVDNNKSLSEVLIATGFPYTDFSFEEDYIRAFRNFLPKCRGLRRLGSAALDIAMVADSTFGGYWEGGLQPWDILGGSVIAQEAGCIVTDFSGNDSKWIAGKEIVLAPPRIHEEMLQLIEKK